MKLVLDLQACQAGNRERSVGRYSLALAQAIARQGQDHDITLILNNAFPETVAPLRHAFDGLLPADKIRVFDVPPGIGKYDPGAIWRGRAAIHVWQRYLAHMKPDVVHIASLFEGWGDDAVTAVPPQGCNSFNTAVTLYDLIPFLHQDHYLSMPFFREWYLRKVQALKNADLLLTFSESSRQQAIDHLRLPVDRVANISAAVDPGFKPVNLTPEAEAALRQHYRLERPFLMYSGGIDYRKNLEGLVEAISRLPPLLRSGYQLAIVGRIRASDQQRLEELAKRVGLAPDAVVCTGAVSDNDLLALYNCATLFVSPVLHEGFGLPVLEAMSCGVPVLGANCNSIPEIIGRPDALFDPNNLDDMASRIHQALTDDGFRATLREHGLQQSRRFSWDRSAQRALDAFASRQPLPAEETLDTILSLASPSTASPSLLSSPAADSLLADSAEDPLSMALQMPVLPLPHGLTVPKPLPDPGRNPDAATRNGNGSLPLRLAFVSPLPPQGKGKEKGQQGSSSVASYCAELIQELARYYLVEIISDQPEIEPVILTASFTIRPVAWFRQHAGVYDRILYHFANHASHQMLFDLLAEHPGIVVLHDFFLGDVLKNPDKLGRPHPAYRQALYHSHGYPGLVAQQRNKLETGSDCSLWQYPCNRQVIDGADGIIAHTTRFRHLAKTWYGPDAASRWQTLPRLHTLPNRDEAHLLRKTIRNSLNLFGKDFLVAVFGMETAGARSLMLFEAWMVSALAGNPQCHMVFVGMNESGHYGQTLRQMISESPVASRIHITGTLEGEEYPGWLRAADMAILLDEEESNTTLNALLDCLAHGLPTLASSPGEGSLVATVPDDILYKLPADFMPSQLVDALERMQAEPELRRVLSLRGIRYVAEHHHPARIGQLYWRAIEVLAAQDDPGTYRNLLRALSEIVSPYPPDEEDLLAVTASTAENHRPPGPRQMLVDITGLVEAELLEGAPSPVAALIQPILDSLLTSPPADYRVEPVFNDGKVYRYARTLTLEKLQIPGGGLEDSPIEVRRGDIFLGLDLVMHQISQQQRSLLQLRNRGVSMNFIVYDLLPLHQPDGYSPAFRADFHAWLKAVSQIADNLLCTSHALSDELLTWLKQQAGSQLASPRITYFHLGSQVPEEPVVQQEEQRGLFSRLLGRKPDASLMAAMEQGPTFMMVGPLAPHRGHLQTLQAMDRLWHSDGEGSRANLLLIGPRCEYGESVARHVKKHGKFGKQLFWLEEADPALLDSCYRHASALIVAVEATEMEPAVLDAAHYHLPLIARRLPVFEELAGDHAYYFDGLDANDLAACLRDWLQQYADKTMPDSARIKRFTWRQSTQQLLDAVMGRSTYRQVPARSLIGISP